MRRFSIRLVTGAAAAVLVGASAAACAGDAARPPAAEFLVASADSTFWVRSDERGVHVRGAPLTLARDGGHFYELFVVDDDRSFYDAVLVGQRLYRRDLLTGDSAVVFADSVVPRIASRYAAAHPAEYPLTDDEEPSDDPEIVANSEVELVSVHGPYATYEYHTDVDRGGDARYTTRRGVIDWRSGALAPLAAIVGPAAARAAVREGRRRFDDQVAAVRASRDPRAEDARRILGGFAFDERSFSLVAVGGRPAIAFVAPGAGPDAGGLTLPIVPVVVSPAPAWWADAAANLPEASPDPAMARWRRPHYGIVARYAGDSSAAVALVDDARREWPVGAVRPPIERVLWLDAPGVDSHTRRALVRAFDESALYAESSRLASRRRHPAGAAPGWRAHLVRRSRRLPPR